MKLVCLIKQIPRPDAIEFDQETKSLKREGVPLILNPFDARAVAEAVRLRDAIGGEVIAMTMGPPQAEDALRECLGLGADRCIHLSDPAFALADTIGTSRTLALALEKEGYDLVLCGRKTLDAETHQVPPEVAAFLGRPHATGSVGLDRQGDRLHVHRETDEGQQTIELPLPAVVSVARAQREPAAGPREGRIDVWTASDLVDDLPEAAARLVVERERPHVLLIPATLRGRDLGPRLAGELQFGMTADCVDLGIDRGGRLVQHKPAYGGNIVSVIMGSTTPQLATVRPRMFEPLQPRDVQAEVRQIDLGALPEGTRVLERAEMHPRPRRLDEADLIVAVGV